MKAIKLYKQLEKDFITSDMSDEWLKYMNEVAEFLSDEFKRREMGLVCDFTKEINKVYTAVFPSDTVLQKILDDGVENGMLFVHHPMVWDIINPEGIFKNMSKEFLEQLEERQISIYNLHSPLDNFGEYSTSLSLAKELGIKIVEPFAPYRGGLAGVIGEVIFGSVKKMQEKIQAVLEHKTALYLYGDEIINNNKVAVVAGGGNDLEILQEMLDKNVKTLITGVSVKNEYSEETHKFAKENKINIIGGTHYSTEKFACMAMVDYFQKLGLKSEFIPDKPMLEDL